MPRCELVDLELVRRSWACRSCQCVDVVVKDIIVVQWVSVQCTAQKDQESLDIVARILPDMIKIWWYPYGYSPDSWHISSHVRRVLEFRNGNISILLEYGVNFIQDTGHIQCQDITTTHILSPYTNCLHCQNMTCTHILMSRYYYYPYPKSLHQLSPLSEYGLCPYPKSYMFRESQTPEWEHFYSSRIWS